MIADPTRRPFAQRELEHDAARIHHVEESLNIRSLAVHQIGVLVLHAGANGSGFRGHEHSPRMLFGQPLRQTFARPSAELHCMLVHVDAFGRWLYAQPQPEVIRGRRDLRVAGIAAICVRLPDMSQTLDTALARGPDRRELEQVDLAGGRTGIALELALQLDAAEVGAR